MSSGVLTVGQSTGTPVNCNPAGIEEFKDRQNKIAIVTNPVINDELVFQFYVAEPSLVQVKVCDFSGRIMQQEYVNIIHRNNLLKLNLSNIPPRMYILNAGGQQAKWVKE